VAQCYRTAAFGGVFRAACRFTAPATQEFALPLGKAQLRFLRVRFGYTQYFRYAKTAL